MAHLFAHLPEQRALPPFEHLNPLDIENRSAKSAATKRAAGAKGKDAQGFHIF
jgi:hypothetical protein